MDNIIKAMRVLKEELDAEFESFDGSAKYDPVFELASVFAVAIQKAADRLESEAVPVKYGCHCNNYGQPDECVFDNGDIEDCVFAIKLERKEDCEHWQPIRIVK